MIVVDANGITIDTYDDLLDEIQTDFRTAFGASIATRLESVAGQLQRLITMRELQIQEQILALYQQQDPRLAEGVHQDQRYSLIGVRRRIAQYAEVLGTATGTPATSIPDGHRVSVGGYVFQTADGPYVIGGGGTIDNVKVVAEEFGPVDVSALGAWTLVDTLSGFTSFDDDSQPVEGRLLETDAEYRTRRENARYLRTHQLEGIEAAVREVQGVTYVKASHNLTTATDANGIPPHGIHVAVTGGYDDAVAEAIFYSKPAGHLTYGATGGSPVSVAVSDDGTTETITFDRLSTTDQDIWVEATLTTSTSEEAQLAELSSIATGLLVDYATANWEHGTDVLPSRLDSVLAGLSGVDAVSCEVSLDDAATDPYSTAKRSIGETTKAVLIAARVTITEN